ncbi:S-layer homology domain-containing protein [Gorillibacterium sp. sgz5001074]|uniref:S-layer homology domain-containing protein n=1 Tax=Gorillibacterium sp. sgz5001074 TaxID=3446695 RepID=UPI003F670176
MRKGNCTIAGLLLALLLAACIPGVVYADGDTAFTLSQSSERVLPDQTLEVTIHGSNLKGLYAYEALITFDSDMVELDKAESKLEGFFIPPKAANGKMTIAFTKIGKKAGEQGDVALSRIVFKGKASGSAHIKLESVKALDPSLTAAVYRYGAAFDDLGGYEWARMQIESLAASGIIKGTSAAAFSPGEAITRADFMCLLVRALQLHAEPDGQFDDVEPSDYYDREVGIARKLGIAQGIGDNRFDPGGRISRQDMIVLATRAMKKAGRMLDEPASDLGGFRDSEEVAAYAVNALGQMHKAGIIQGHNGMIKPNDTATRAEAAVILYRLLNK